LKVDNYEESGGESEKEKEEGESEEEKEDNKKEEVEEDKEENKKEEEQEEQEEQEYTEEVLLSQQVSFFGHIVTTRPFFTFFTFWSRRCDTAIFHILQFSVTLLRRGLF
jgi:hypothetical protein